MNVPAEIVDVVQSYAKALEVHYVLYRVKHNRAFLDADVCRINGAVEVKLDGECGPFPVPTLKSLRAYLTGPDTPLCCDVLVLQYTGHQALPRELENNSTWSETMTDAFSPQTFRSYFDVESEFHTTQFTVRAMKRLYKRTMAKLATHAWETLVG